MVSRSPLRCYREESLSAKCHRQAHHERHGEGAEQGLSCHQAGGQGGIPAITGGENTQQGGAGSGSCRHHRYGYAMVDMQQQAETNGSGRGDNEPQENGQPGIPPPQNG